MIQTPDIIEHFDKEYRVIDIMDVSDEHPVTGFDGWAYLVGCRTSYAKNYETTMLTSHGEVLPIGDTIMHVKAVYVDGEQMDVSDVDGEYAVTAVAEVKKEGSHHFGYVVHLSEEISSDTKQYSIYVEEV